VISLKKFLSPNTEDQTTMRVVRLLVQGIGQHSISGDANDGARFRESMEEISEGLVDGISAADLNVRAGSVLRGLQDHNGRTARQQQLQTAELQNMLKMLSYTVGVISAIGKAKLDRLEEIQKQVGMVSELDDIRMIKVKLSECLADIRKEAECQKKETGETIEQLNRGIFEARKSAASAGTGEGIDGLTALPLRHEAEAALAESGRAGSQDYVAVMVLDRLQVLNQRFGRELGDAIVVAFVDMLKKRLNPEDLIFRWGGPAFVALLARPGSLERVRSELGRIMEAKLEHSIETSHRSVLVPIAARWTLFPMMAAPRLIYQKIDTFAAIPTERD
jgi:diguanylate cyclase (GGDEF)-like protein